MSDKTENKTDLSDSAIPERGKVKAVEGEPQPPKRVMSINAHPDDQEFTVGGTLAKWARLGTEVISVCITSGDAGSNEHTEPSMTGAQLARLREEEQKAANGVLGVKETVFLRYHDGVLQATIELRRDLTRVIRRYKPDAIICGDPTVRFYGNSYMNHPDHRAAADAACDAAFPSAGTRLIFTELLDEGLEPWEVKRVFLHGPEKPDVWVDIKETLPLKIEALRQHKTQLADWDPTEMMTEWARDEGKERGFEQAEAFRMMILKDEEPGKEEAREKQPEYAEAEL